MSTIQPPPPRIAPTAVTGQNAATVVAVKAPPVLSSIPVGQAINATVGTSAVANQMQVFTALGPITLQTNLAFPKGAVLALVLTNLKPPTFLIGAIDGKPIPGALTPAQAKTAGLITSSNQTAQAPLQPLQVGAKLNAVLLRPALGGSSPQGLQTQAGAQQAGTTPTQTASIGQSQTATPGGTLGQALATGRTGQGTSTTGTGAASTTRAASTPQPTGLSTTALQQSGVKAASISGGQNSTVSGQSNLPSGTRFNISIIRIESPNAALSTSIPGVAKGLAQGQTVTGTVVGRTPQGGAIVQTPNATLGLDTKSPLAEGTKITLRFESPALASEPSTAAKRLGLAGLGQELANAKTWDDLNEALKTIAAIDPSRLQNVVQRAVPQPGSKLSNQMIFFLNALKGGDIKSLFGDPASRLIDKARPGLLSRMGKDFKVMSGLAEHPQQGDWKLALIPLWNGQQLDQVRLYHRGKHREDNGGEDDGARFVLDVDMSNLGHIQIDGLIKAKKTRLDLIVRSEQSLPEDMRKHIIDIGLSAEDTFGMNTSVSFQANPQDFIIFPQTTPPEPGLMA